MSAMRKKGGNRTRRGETLVNKGKLIAMTKKEEGLFLQFEAKMQAPGQVPNPRHVRPHRYFNATKSSTTALSIHD